MGSYRVLTCSAVYEERFVTKKAKALLWHEHTHAARSVAGGMVAIATGVYAWNPDLTELGLQTVLEIIWKRQQDQQQQQQQGDEALPA